MGFAVGPGHHLNKILREIALTCDVCHIKVEKVFRRNAMVERPIKSESTRPCPLVNQNIIQKL